MQYIGYEEGDEWCPKSDIAKLSVSDSDSDNEKEGEELPVLCGHSSAVVFPACVSLNEQLAYKKVCTGL